MSSLTRMLAVLDLFTAQAPAWSPDDLADRLGVSRPTSYRYVRELVAAGLLRRASDSVYTLGPRIIELDFQIRSTDPLSRAGEQVARELVERIGFSVTLISLYGTRMITLHLEQGAEPIDISYGRGRPLPLLRGTPSLTLLAFLPRARQRALYEAQTTTPEPPPMPFDTLRARLQAIRRAGYGTSEGELDPHNAGIAVPVHDAGGQAIASLCAVVPRARVELLNVERLVLRLREAAERISMLAERAGADRP